MPWTPLEARAPELQDQIAAIAAAAKPPITGSDYYNQNDLGQLSADALTAWLSETQVNLDGSSTPTNEDEPLPEITEAGAFDARSLRWIRLNGRTAADKAYAKQRYRQLLFELWRKHIADTGQTYYPKLRNDLMDHFQLLSDQDQN